jgi:hypothetical protein
MKRTDIDLTNDTSIIEFANDKVSFHQPKFKTEHFVGGGQMTPFKKMQQYFIELRVKQDAFLQCEFEGAKKELEVEIEEEKLKRAEEKGDKLEVAYQKLDLLQIRKDLKKFQDNQRQALREKDHLLQLVRELDASPEGTLPDGTKLLDVFGDEEKEEQLEKEYWTMRLAKQASTEMLAYGKVGTGNIDAIAMLPRKMQEETLELATQYSTRFAIGMNKIQDKVVNDLRIGYQDDKTKQRLMQIGIAEGLEDEDLLKNEVGENNSVINNKYKEIETSSQEDGWSLKE